MESVRHSIAREKRIQREHLKNIGKEPLRSLLNRGILKRAPDPPHENQNGVSVRKTPSTPRVSTPSQASLSR